MAKTATHDAGIISFDETGDRAIAVAFVAGGDCSLEEKCLIAGEAVRAIWIEIAASAATGWSRKGVST